MQSSVRTCNRGSWCSADNPTVRKSRPAERYTRSDSGFVLSGGKDLASEIYGAAPHPAAKVQPARDNFEIALTRLALERSMPILGVCRAI
ncbi:MAG: hypothetical protein EOS25_02195 [Mesorhizobium sp.]|uniref:gamma-glutamyl-gamma-aminobutyrate hydrolase family protein n=1 Tax=Mesorhizobium sp. TaxID=1871066 RepID=UPI000FE55872|nr:MAG: hypothetical protein EOS59_08140 [Mesorhizobium sp.]RWE58689.1 MAG: hypothetical protein EOS24_16920 [Mesorhizobium sp.]RWF09090.1 MAG: hypothetical protein EOS69_21065 [Mesorhizobium sp.]RWF22349.1 MAG: hypothetical protein EOS25_02195 [Mesorhizobium sp.]TIY06716.1 MAG: hypothetical protein E5V22_02035 [Mesorhizobium sp.]